MIIIAVTENPLKQMAQGRATVFTGQETKLTNPDLHRSVDAKPASSHGVDHTVEYVHTVEGKFAYMTTDDNTYTDEAYSLTTSQPSDWETNWKEYCVLIAGTYYYLSGDEAPDWEANTYYYPNPEIP